MDSSQFLAYLNSFVFAAACLVNGRYAIASRRGNDGSFAVYGATATVAAGMSFGYFVVAAKLLDDNITPVNVILLRPGVLFLAILLIVSPYFIATRKQSSGQAANERRIEELEHTLTDKVQAITDRDAVMRRLKELLEQKDEEIAALKAKNQL